MLVTIYPPKPNGEPVFCGPATMTIQVSGRQDNPEITMQLIAAHLDTIGKLKLTRAEMIELIQATARAIDHLDAQTQPEDEYGAD